jgi:tRNA (cmo5U34)-methyltransferase
LGLGKKLEPAMTVGQAFDRSVKYYDDWMKLALPSYDALFSTALELIPFDEKSPIKVLDLGAGTGLFSEHILSKYPKAEFLLSDLAPKMLEVAKERFRGNDGQFKYLVDDYRHYQVTRKYDLVISSLSIHHLEDIEKKNLFTKIYQSLKNTGIFINIDQIKGPTQSIQDLYWSDWLRKVREKEAPEEQILASIQRRKEYDKDALLVDQLRWLSEAGFANADCVYKNYFIGVFFASKEINN